MNKLSIITVPQTNILRLRPIINEHLLTKTRRASTEPTIEYRINLVSIISPGNLVNYKLMAPNTATPVTALKKKKLFIKQSYMLLTWLAYFKQHVLFSKGGDKPHGFGKAKAPSFFIFPKKTAKKTLLKAPMAHKTFSQEQYIFKFYSLSVRYKAEALVDRGSRGGLPLEASLLFFLIQKRMPLPVEGTNLFFVRRYSLLLNVADKHYFTLR